MNDIVPHAVHLFPRSLRMCLSKFFGKHIRSFSKNFYVLDYCVIHHVVCDKILKVFTFLYIGRFFLSPGACAIGGFYLYFVLSYTKILSRSTDSCAKGSKVPSDTKSTFLPKSSSKSFHMPKNFKPIGLLLSKETIILISLSFVSSPLEKEPTARLSVRVGC